MNKLHILHARVDKGRFFKKSIWSAPLTPAVCKGRWNNLSM
jgi:hypothetical protein